MPFVPGKGVDDAVKDIRELARKRIFDRARRALTVAGYNLGAHADQYVPIETGALINSRRQEVNKSGDTITLTLGYYQTYAGFLHNPKPGGKLDGWKPRPVPSPGKKTGGYNPDAKQGWLDIAWNEIGDEITKDIFKRVLK